MYNLTFTSLRACMDSNKLTEAELVEILQSKMKNDNYREAYNKAKNLAEKELKQDPKYAARRKELLAKIRKA